MTKKEIIEKLKAAGVEVPANANLATLQELAKEKGVTIDTDGASDETPPTDGPTKEEAFDAAVREKVRAGLSKEQAIEVLTSQQAHDEQLAAESKKAKA